MYNLIIGLNSSEFLEEGRVFEYTDDELISSAMDDGTIRRIILDLPTLFMPEPQDTNAEQVARIGRVVRFDHTGKNYRIRFLENSHISPMSTRDVVEIQAKLGIDSKWEFNRTHFAVKDVDLYEVLLEWGSGYEGTVRPSREVLRFPEDGRIEDQVGVMMPFHDRFNPVWRAIQEASHDQNLRCKRAADMWRSNAIIDDIAEILWRSKIVVADLSEKNPNVYYEIGAAHCIGATCIPITNSIDDVPFDLKHLRMIEYDNSELGLEKLKSQLTRRLSDILSGFGSAAR